MSNEDETVDQSVETEFPSEEGSSSEAETEQVEEAGPENEGERSPQDAAHDEVFCSSCGESIKREAEICPHCGVRQNAGSGLSGERNPGISALASLIIPGAGQMYNGQMGRGAIAFIGAAVADVLIVLLATILTLILIGPLFLIFIPVVHLGIAYDAYNQAEKINKGEITV